MNSLTSRVRAAVRTGFVGVAAAAALVVSSSSQALPFDYTTITSAVDWTGVATGIGAIAVAAAGVFIVLSGARFIIGMIRKPG